VSEENETGGALAEFTALRQEIERRNVVQHALFVLQLTSAGAIFSFALAGEPRARFLLIVPISTYMICARYVDQQIGIQRAATYIRTELSPRISGGLGWENWQINHREFVRGSIIRRVTALLIMFPIIGVCALVWVFGTVFGTESVRLNVAEHVGFVAIWFLDVISVMVCLHMIWSMLRYPLGDASPSPLFPLPARLRREETTIQAPTEESGIPSSVNER
jgi:hypothetical protein